MKSEGVEPQSAVVTCQVCGQDQTLRDEESSVGGEVFIMDCCFSIVCKDCVGVSNTAASSQEGFSYSRAEENAKSRICLACLEPIQPGQSEGHQRISLSKFLVLITLFASINDAKKQAAASVRDSSSIFNFITGSSQSPQLSKVCHRCQKHDHRYACFTCSGDKANPTRLCDECHTLIHSLGTAFKAHKVFENVLHSEEKGAESTLLTTLVTLLECPRHQQPIEFYLEEESEREDSAAGLPAVAYACQKCLGTLPERGREFAKIDEDNLLNVYQLKLELFKERQKSLATLDSMLRTLNLDVVERLPELRRGETKQLEDVIARIVKTLHNKQREIQQQIDQKFQKLADHVHKEKQRMLTKKEVIERNYNLLERALEVVPLQILSCEEGLLEAILMANQALMKVVRGQEAKLLQRQSLYGQQQASEATKQEAPFHLIEPEQQRRRLQTLESFAAQIDSVVTELFKQASDQLDVRLEQQLLVPRSLISPQYSHQLQTSPRMEQYQLQAYQTARAPSHTAEDISSKGPRLNNYMPLQSDLASSGTAAADEKQTQHADDLTQEKAQDLKGVAQTVQNRERGPGTQGFLASNNQEDLFGTQYDQNVTPQAVSTDLKRQSVQAARSGVLAAFVTQQNQQQTQLKSRMQRDVLAKSHLSIGQPHALDMTQEKKSSDQAQPSSKGGTSRREQSYSAAGRGSSQSMNATNAAHQAYLQTASYRYAANAAAVVKSNSTLAKNIAATNNNSKWDSSTRVVTNKRDNSVSSQNQAPLPVAPGGQQSLPRNSSYLQSAKDRSSQRPQGNTLTGVRSGAHSTVGQSERWTTNAGKRDSNLDMSQDLSNANDLQNQKNGNIDSSPRLSRNQISMNNLVAAKQDRLQSDPEKQIIKENMAIIEQNCLAPRVFTHVAQTSTAIQVAWSHPAGFQKVLSYEDENGLLVQRRQHIQYVLEYGIGVKVDNKEQFRQIYKGKAHKCIITDLMPRTTFRLRVAPILNYEKPVNAERVTGQPASSFDGEAKKQMTVVQEQGEWSEVTNITTKETQNFDVGGSLSSTNPKAPNLMCAQLVTKGRKKWVSFDKAGTLMAIYGYSFGEHLWCLKICYQEPQQPSIGGVVATSAALDQSGSMVVGVVNKRFSNQKMFGSVINYSIFKGEIIAKIYLDSNKKRMIVYSPQHPQGDVFTDLPKDGLFYPAVQNKTTISKQKSSLKVFFKFEQQVPKEKAEIGANLIYSSDEAGDNVDEVSQQSMTIFGGGASQSMNNSMTQQTSSKEDAKRQEPVKKSTQREKAQRPTSSTRMNPGGGGAGPGTRLSQNQKESQITQINGGQGD